MLVLFGTSPGQRLEDDHVRKMIQRTTEETKINPCDPLRPGTLNNTLHDACSHDLPHQVSIVRILSSYPGMDVNAIGDKGHTPLILACVSGRLSVARELLANPRVDVNFKFKGMVMFKSGTALVQQSNSFTSLFAAAFLGHLDIIKYIIALRGKEIHLESIQRIFGCDSEYANVVKRALKQEVITLMRKFIKDPVQTSVALRRELGVCVSKASHMFAIIIMTCDHYLQINWGIVHMDGAAEHDMRETGQKNKIKQCRTNNNNNNKTLRQWVANPNLLPPDHEDAHHCCGLIRFIQIAIQLPMELQTVLCLRAFDIHGVIIPLADRAHALNILCNELSYLQRQPQQ